MSDKEPLQIKMRGDFGEIDIIIPYTYIAYNVCKEPENRLMSAVNVAIQAYKALNQ